MRSRPDHASWMCARGRVSRDIPGVADPRPAHVRPLKPDQYEGLIVVDYPPFQYAYQFDAPDEITIVAVTLCWPYSHHM